MDSMLHEPLSLTGKRWTLAPVTGRDAAPEDDALAMIELLKESRGISAQPMTDTGEWHNHRLFPDAEKAAKRIRGAIKERQQIGLFGDYDCDGITSAAQMIRYFRRHGTDPAVRLPHRVHDGYGIKAAHIDEFIAKGVQLIVTVDTGISAHEAIDHANDKGIDVIVLDHHHLLTPPNAYAILHPALAPGFPHPHPSAAGVAFMFLHALEERFWADRDTDLTLAMIGTIADLVQLKGLNRSLVQAGLRAMGCLEPCPLKLLIDQTSGGSPLTSVDIAFRIAPRINAAGRMADPTIALKALLEGGELLRDLDTLNSLRQEQTTRAMEHALRELTPDASGELPAFLAIASSSYPHGILGLLAGKLTEKFGRPSMAVHIGEHLCTASFRSPAGYNIVQALERNKHLLMSFGGHAQAAGATFTLEKYLTLTEALEKDTKAAMPATELIPTLAIDAILPASAVTQNFCNALTSLEPFGQGNPEPLFLIENVMIQNIRRVGNEGKHLQGTIGPSKIIGFNLGHLASETHRHLDIVCRVGIDTWNGRVTPQLFLTDMRVAQTSENSLPSSRVSVLPSSKKTPVTRQLGNP